MDFKNLTWFTGLQDPGLEGIINFSDFQTQKRRIKTWDQSRIQFSSVQFSSVTQSCPTLCDPMNHSTPGLPVHHQLPEFTQTHIHRVHDAIQPSHPRSAPSPPAPKPSQHHYKQSRIRVELIQGEGRRGRAVALGVPEFPWQGDAIQDPQVMVGQVCSSQGVKPWD